MGVRGSLHPVCFSSCVNRRGVGSGLGVCVRTTGSENRTLSRILFCKPPKLKGAALTKVVTGRVNAGVGIASNPTVNGPKRVTTVLGKLSRKSVLFISRVRELGHRIRRILCPTVRSCTVSVVVNGNRSTGSVEFGLPGFALMKTAAETNVLSTPLQSEFNIMGRVRFCAISRLGRVVIGSTGILKMRVSSGKTCRVTEHSENAPELTGELLGHIESFTRIGCSNGVACSITDFTLSLLRISGCKLSLGSEGVLLAVVSGFTKKPINLSALTTTVNRSTKAVRSICRPCLIGGNFVGHAPGKHITASLTFRRFREGETWDYGLCLWNVWWLDV